MVKKNESEPGKLEILYVPVVCFEGQDRAYVESAEGRVVRGHQGYVFYRNKDEAVKALAYLTKQYEAYSFQGKILTFKRMKDAE